MQPQHKNAVQSQSRLRKIRKVPPKPDFSKRNIDTFEARKAGNRKYNKLVEEHPLTEDWGFSRSFGCRSTGYGLVL